MSEDSYEVILLNLEKKENYCLLTLEINRTEIIDSTVTFKVNLENITEESWVSEIESAIGLELRYLKNILNYQEYTQKTIFQIIMNIRQGNVIPFPFRLSPPYAPHKLLGIINLENGRYLLAVSIDDEIITYQVNFNRSSNPKLSDLNNEFQIFLDKYAYVRNEIENTLEEFEDGNKAIFPVFLSFIEWDETEDSNLFVGW